MLLIGIDKPTLDTIKNPFEKKAFKRIHITIHPEGNLFTNGKKCTASVNFKRDNTSGSQDFYNDNFLELVKEIDAFLLSLP